MNDRAPTKRDLLLRQRAMRVVENALPDQVRQAYEQVPSDLIDLPSDDPQRLALRERARASLLAHNRLTEDELETLPVDQAVAVAMQRVRDHVASLQAQADLLASQDRASAARSRKPPRTLPRR